MGQTQHERSAGVVVFRDAPGREFLLLDYGRHWDFPKGHVEAGETDQIAAKRELLEETGIDAVDFVEGYAREIEYYFRGRGGVLIHKKVIFFLGKVPADANVVVSHEHTGFLWADGIGALTKITYPAAREILESAEAFLVSR